MIRVTIPRSLLICIAAHCFCFRKTSRDTCQIAVTRSLGDFYAIQFGLGSIPDITVRELDLSTDFFLVVASDGVWDVWAYKDFARMLLRTREESEQEIAEGIIQHSNRRSRAYFGSNTDDASVAVIRVIGNAF